MQKLVTILFCLAVLSSGLKAQQADTLSNSLLWKVSGHDIADSYLFGTIHLIPQEHYFLPKGTEGALEHADRIVFEIDMKEMMDIGAQLGMFMKAIMPDGKRLQDLLSEEDYSVVENHFDKMGLPMFLFDRVKPMFLSIFASGDMSMDDLSSGDMKSYEMEFFDYALENEKETGGLETMAFQISVFDSIPYDVQAEMLVEAIRAGDEGSDEYDILIETYKAQNVDMLYEMLTATDAELSEYEELIVTDRNENWISGMKSMMSEGTVFFAVGAGHLGGDLGVVRLLREEGYTVTPVSSDLKGSSRLKQRF